MKERIVKEDVLMGCLGISFSNIVTLFKEKYIIKHYAVYVIYIIILLI